MNGLFDRRPDGLPPELDGKLRAIIRRVRLIQIARGLCATLAVAVVGTLAVMAVDAALVIPADAVRAALSCGVLALTLATAYVALARPLSSRISTVRMARILETRHPELQERISSAIELLSQGGAGAAAGSRQLLELLVADARADASALSASGEFRGDTLRPVAVAAAASVSLLLLLLLVVPRQASLLLLRAVAPVAPRDNLAARDFSVEPGNLTIVEGETVRFVLVARGGDGERAELLLSRQGEPATVERMARRYDPDGGDPVFELTVPAVAASFDYRMRLGRALTRRYRLTVVPPPAAGELVCSLAPPDYTGLSATQLVATAAPPLRAPFGTRADLAVRLNRPARARLLFGAARSLEPAEAGAAPEATFSWTLSTNASPRWALSLRDDRGFTNDLFWADYEVIPDYPPDVRLVYPSGTAYTLPTYGHLKVVYELRDDYGVASARLALQPDGDAPWTSDLAPEPTGKGMWRIAHDISLGEFMIGGARRIRIWVEVADGLPAHLGGPNVSRSRVIAVNLDNAERRSLADQVRVPERDALTNLLEAAAARLDEAARRLAAATNAPSETAFAEAVEAAEAAAAEAGEKVEEAAKTASDGLFAGVANEIAALPEESLEAVGDALAEVPLTEEQQREQAIRKLVEEMNRAAEETRAVVPEVLEADAVIEKAAALENLAAEEAREARKAQERQLTNDELDTWQAKQMELVNRFGALDEPVDAGVPKGREGQALPAPLPAKADGAAPEQEGVKAETAAPEASPQQREGRAPARPLDEQRPASETIASAAQAAAKAADAAREAPKDELLLKQARALQAAAGEGRRAAVEARRAQDAKAAIERDREPLAKIAKAAESVAREAEALADDALVVTLETIKEAAKEPSPEVRRAQEVAHLAEKLAALADQAASRPGTVSPDKLAALADSLSAEAEKLAGSDDLHLRKAAEMAKRVAEAARAQANQAGEQEGATAETPSPQREGRAPARSLGEQAGEPPTEAAAEADAAETKGDGGQQQADGSKERLASAVARAAEAAREAAETAALSPREQAAAASSSAAAAASAATNLAARLEAAIKPPVPAETPAAETPATETPAAETPATETPAAETPAAEAPAVEANSQPSKAGHPDAGAARESSLPATFEELRREAERLAEEAREAVYEADAAERQAQKSGARNAQQAAQRARRAADSARQSAEAVRDAAAKAAEAALAAQRSPLPDGAEAENPADKSAETKPFASPQEVTAKAAEARRQADEAQRRVEENRHAAESLAAAPSEHAARAAAAAGKAAELAAELARATGEQQQADDSKAEQTGGPQSPAAADQEPATTGALPQQQADDSKAAQPDGTRPSPATPEETRAALERALEETRREAQFANETAGDVRENLPVDAATVARQAADQAQDAVRAFDASRAEPAPGQQPPNRAALADRARKAAQRAGELAEKAQRLADRAADDPDGQMRPFREARESAEGQLRDMAETMAASAAAIQSNLPISQTNAAAAAAVADARLAFDKAVGEAAEIARSLNEPIAELPPVVANADRVAKEEKAALAAQGSPWSDDSPAAHTAREARETQQALEAARRMANDLSTAARYGSQNPANAARVANAALEKLPKRDESAGGDDAAQAENAAAGDSRPPDEDEPSAPRQGGENAAQTGGSRSRATEGDGGDTQPDADEPSALRQGDENAAQTGGSRSRATGRDRGDAAVPSGPLGELARKLDDAREGMGNARNALAAGDADQAREVAREAAVQAADVARAATALETDRQTQAGKSEKASASASAAAEKGAGQLLESLAAQPPDGEGAHPLLEASAPVLAGAASNVVAAAGQAAVDPDAARRLAEEAIKVAKSLQTPSADQLEAARQANLASQELRRLAAETAASIGLDPETMKVKKPDGGKRGDKGDKTPEKLRPARTEGGPGGDPNANREPESGEYEDGISLEMPEWLRRLGFPRSEWLKYGGSLESGLPESALEHVAPEYRALVREYFRYLSKEK